MQHPDSDDLALIALGEDLGEAIADHVDSCPVCQEEIAAFSVTVGLAELANYGEDAPRPGEHVWLAISNELGFTGATSTLTAVDSPSRSTGGPGDESSKADATTNGNASSNRNAKTNGNSAGDNNSRPVLQSVPGTGSDLSDSAVPATSTTKRRRWVAPLAAVVAGIAIGAGAVAIAQNRSDNVTVEAVAPLTPVQTGPLSGEAGQFGEAELVAVPTGTQVRVNAPDLPPTGNAYEVWLFGEEGRMVSLGTLSDGIGTFTVPQGINPQEYRVVDVSDEAPDGNPAHSGISLVRGAFS